MATDADRGNSSLDFPDEKRSDKTDQKASSAC
jgi:hypothetical protein